LDWFTWVIEVHEDGLDGVLIQTAGPWVGQMIKEDLKYSTGFNSNGILSIIEPFQKFWID